MPTTNFIASRVGLRFLNPNCISHKSFSVISSYLLAIIPFRIFPNVYRRQGGRHDNSPVIKAENWIRPLHFFRTYLFISFSFFFEHTCKACLLSANKHICSRMNTIFFCFGRNTIISRRFLVAYVGYADCLNGCVQSSREQRFHR